MTKNERQGLQSADVLCPLHGLLCGLKSWTLFWGHEKPRKVSKLGAEARLRGDGRRSTGLPLTPAVLQSSSSPLPPSPITIHVAPCPTHLASPPFPPSPPLGLEPHFPDHAPLAPSLMGFLFPDLP